MEQEFYMTRLDWVEDSTKSVWNGCRTLKTVCSIREKIILNGKHCFPYITDSFQFSFHALNLEQTFQTGLVESSAQSSVVI